MLTFDLSLYILIGLSIAAIVLSIWLLVTNARFSGTLTLLGGLILAGLTTFMWYSFKEVYSNTDLFAARDQIKRQSNEIVDLEDRLKKSAYKLEQFKNTRLRSGNDFDSMRSRLNESEKQLAIIKERLRSQTEIARKEVRRLDESHTKVQDLTQRLTREISSKEDLINRTSHQLDMLLERARQIHVDIGTPVRVDQIPLNRKLSDNDRRIELLDREIRRLSHRAIRQTKDLGLSSELRELKGKLAYGLSTKDYEVDVYPDREVISGQKGSYYVIDLKDAQSGIKFGFQAGKYTLDRSDRQFRKALSKFMRDVVEKLDGRRDYKLMVRGSADAAAYIGRQNKDYFYRQIAYLPQVRDGRYVNNQSNRKLNARIENDDLPFLRAKYLKELVSDVFPAIEASILEGKVSPKINLKDRNAELILFIDW